MQFLAFVQFFFISFFIFHCSQQQEPNNEQDNVDNGVLETDLIEDSGKEEEEVEQGFNFLISGGKKDVLHTQNIKFLVSIRTRGPQKFFGDNHFCAGTLIRRSTVITAAHCVMSPDKVLVRSRLLLIVAGTPNRLRIDPHTTRQYPVLDVRVHPLYIQRDTHDIAVITIKGQIPDDNEMIQRIPMPKKPPEYGTKCITLGWGRIFAKGPLAAVPMYIELTLNTPQQCAQKTAFYKNDAGMLCADIDGRSYSDPCRGDNGGPLICNGFFTGVVSWTIGCGKSQPSLYTDVYSNIGFIFNSSQAMGVVVYGLIFNVLLVILT